MKIDLPSVGLKGMFKLSTYDASGNKTRETEWQDNLITDSGLNGFVGYGVTVGNCNLDIGTGNTPPAYTDTSLAAFCNRNNSGYIVSRTRSGGVFSIRMRYTFNLGTILNKNIAELALTANISGVGRVLITRALIRDSSGNPTTFTVTTEESLVIDYIVQSIPDTTVVTGTFNLDKYEGSNFIETVTVNYTANACNLGGGYDPNNDTTSFLAINPFPRSNLYRARESNEVPATASNLSGGTGASRDSPVAWDGVSLHRDRTIVFSPTVANFATGIGGLYADSSGVKWSIVFDPKIPKNSDSRFTITLRGSLGRA